ncbi:MAG: TfoX/Sxy family protein [Anaerolineae bacterium]|nr:TfoX/Sxy family protein [Anaerolineae bacterium]
MRPVGKLANLGPKSTQWLEAVGIRTEDDLEELGAVEAYRRVKARYPGRVSLNLLWALQGALLDLPWNEIPPDMKEKLRKEFGLGGLNQGIHDHRQKDKS